MNHLIQLPELAALVAPSQVVRIPDQMEVPLTPRVRRLVDTAAFGRLRQISQLGLVSAVYPGATHSRLEHSLGVYRNALLYLQQVARFPEVPGRIDTAAASCFLVAALLHDIGHWPYCHAIEDLQIPGWPSHEQLAAEYLESEEIAACLREDWRLEPQHVLALLNKQVVTPGDKILSSLLSGPIDVDKLDYLYRDSLHAGVPYGRQFDTSRVLANLCLNQTGDGIAIREKGRTAAELMVFSRYIMFHEVYWHPAVRSATAMLQRVVFHLRQRLRPADLARMSDEGFRQLLLQWTHETPQAELIQGLFGSRRRLYKRVAQFSLFENPTLFARLSRRPYEQLFRISQSLAEQFNQVLHCPVAADDVLLDAPPMGLEVQFRVTVRLERTGEFRPLGELSPVVQALATRQFDDHVKRVRLFVHPRLQTQLAPLPLESLLENALYSA